MIKKLFISKGFKLTKFFSLKQETSISDTKFLEKSFTKSGSANAKTSAPSTPLSTAKPCTKPKPTVTAKATPSAKKPGWKTSTNLLQLDQLLSKSYLLISIDEKGLPWKFIVKEIF